MKNKNFDKKNYENIVAGLVRKSFPKLRNRKIHIKKSPSNARFSALATRGLQGLCISINPRYDYNILELKGLLAHELIHLEDFSEWGIFRRLVSNIKYLLFKKYREKFEKDTDRRAICRGYKRELKSQRLKRESIKDKRYKKMKRFYLTSKEVEKFVCPKSKK